jgi:hypothetical protein
MNPPMVNKNGLYSSMPRIHLQRGLVFGIIIIAALLAFEFFNYSTTEFALQDLLGNLQFMGIAWATILTIAFCGIDFAGIARLFTPEVGSEEPSEVWYLFAAWLLAATMNAMLTWWGVSIALLNHQSLGSAVISQPTLLKIVPIFVAIMVWLIRVLIIGTLSVAGDRLFSQADRRASQGSRIPRFAGLQGRSVSKPSALPSVNSQPSASQSMSYRPAPKPSPEMTYNRQEPTYHPLGMSAKPGNRGNPGKMS